MSYAKTVGEGGFGKCRVYYSPKFKRKVIEKEVGENFIRTKASKKAHLAKLLSDYSRNEEALKKEMVFMMLTKVAKLDCCVEVLGFTSNPFRIIMEYCEGGDLRKLLDEKDVLVEDRIVMISQILFAIKEMHKAGFIHGDLKCQNIFLVKKYIPGDYKNIRIKIGDFGLSEIGGGLVFGGTIGFMAPEVPIIGGSFESDIYSIGKVMLEIMTKLPVHVIAKIDIASLYSLKNYLPKVLDINQFYDIVIFCLNIDPLKRPLADELYKLFQILMDYWFICEAMNDKMLQKYTIGEKIAVDSHKHPLLLSNAKMREYSGGGWYCNICNNSKHPFLDNTLSFHCRSCEYDLCQKCIFLHNYKDVNDKMIKRVPKGKKVYVSQHEHYLLLSNNQERNYKPGFMTCDICKAESCLEVDSFHCKKCCYDVCLKCYEKNFVIRDDCCCIIY